MAGNGPPPKEPEKRLRTNAEVVPWTDLSPDARPAEAPELPGAEDYCSQTRSWYETWTQSPQATTFLPTDWQRLHMLARLVDIYFTGKPSKDLLAEIRLNEASLGATVADRLRARIRVKTEDAASLGGPARQPSRKRADPRRLQAVK